MDTSHLKMATQCIMSQQTNRWFIICLLPTVALSLEVPSLPGHSGDNFTTRRPQNARRIQFWELSKAECQHLTRKIVPYALHERNFLPWRCNNPELAVDTSSVFKICGREICSCVSELNLDRMNSLWRGGTLAGLVKICALNRIYFGNIYWRVLSMYFEAWNCTERLGISLLYTTCL
jgi:hypothetical protein